MLKPMISSIVYDAAKMPTREEKINHLRRWDSAPLRLYLRMMTDKQLKWLIPSGTPPYEVNNQVDCEMVMYYEARRMYLFIEGGRRDLTDAKRQMLFIRFLESLHAQDAKFMCEVVVPKKLPEGLSMRLINEAFPGIVNWPSDSKDYDGHARKDDKSIKDNLRGIMK